MSKWTNTDPSRIKTGLGSPIGSDDEYVLDLDMEAKMLYVRSNCYRLANYELNEVIAKVWSDETYPVNVLQGYIWQLSEEERIYEDIIHTGIDSVVDGPPPHRWVVPMIWDPSGLGCLTIPPLT